MYENNEELRGGADRCVRTEHCDGRCGETALDSDHVHDEECMDHIDSQVVYK